jgi:hypothetical protein
MALEILLCTYCGVVCDSWDHVVPQHLLKRAGDLKLDLSGLYRMKRWIVPSCRECNSAIGGKLTKTLQDRRVIAKKHIRKKYAAYLRIPDWSDEELEEMGPDAHSDILAAIRIRDYTRERLDWTNPRHNEFDISSVMFLFKEVVKKDVH